MLVNSFLAQIPLFLYPFLHTVSKTRSFEYLRLTSLGVVGALVKVKLLFFSLNRNRKECLNVSRLPLTAWCIALSKLMHLPNYISSLNINLPFA